VLSFFTIHNNSSFCTPHSALVSSLSGQLYEFKVQSLKFKITPDSAFSIHH